jgi:hypothetical protein
MRYDAIVPPPVDAGALHVTRMLPAPVPTAVASPRGASKDAPIVMVVCPVAPDPSRTEMVTVRPAGPAGVKTPELVILSLPTPPMTDQVSGLEPPSLRRALNDAA